MRFVAAGGVNKGNRTASRGTLDSRNGLYHTAKINALPGQVLRFLCGSGWLRIHKGMFGSRHDDPKVSAIRPRNASDPALWSTLKSLDVVLFVRKHGMTLGRNYAFSSLPYPDRSQVGSHCGLRIQNTVKSQSLAKSRGWKGHVVRAAVLRIPIFALRSPGRN
jgi:hypothetical protein